MINSALTFFNDCFRQAKQHAWTVGLLILVIIVLKNQLLRFKSKYLEGHRLASTSTTTSSNTAHENSTTMSSSAQQQSSIVRTAVAAASSNTAARAPPSQEALRLARLLQQETMNERAKIADAERKAKQAAERQKKAELAREQRQKELGRGRRLGDTTTATSSTTSSADATSNNNSGGGGYNPMQPWTAQSSGYRPARRQVQRG